MFTWWADAPYKRAAQALDAYTQLLRERVVGIAPGEDEPIIGDADRARAALDRRSRRRDDAVHARGADRASPSASSPGARPR